MIYCWSVISWRFCYVWICDQDSTRGREPYYLESAIKSRRLLSGQHSLRRTTEKFGKANRVLYTIHQEKSYIYDMSPEMISRTILDKRPGFSDALITFMRTNDNQAQHIIQSIEQSFRDVCGRSFEANDPFASFAVRVIKDEFSFVVKEIAATMLRYVAWDVNRFSVQHMVRDLLLSDLDPMLKDIIKE